MLHAAAQSHAFSGKLAAPAQNLRCRHRCFCSHAADPDRAGPSRRASLVAGLAAAPALLLARSSSASQSAREGEVRHSEAEWRALLNPDQYRVLREAATERRYSSPLVQEHRLGVFCCAGCGSDLFNSETKFESGTGWPSFVQALPQAVDLEMDNSLFFSPRTEVRCKKCQGHLGHVFTDGPAPTGLRYCMNGAALTFRPASA